MDNENNTNEGANGENAEQANIGTADSQVANSSEEKPEVGPFTVTVDWVEDITAEGKSEAMAFISDLAKAIDSEEEAFPKTIKSITISRRA